MIRRITASIILAVFILTIPAQMGIAQVFTPVPMPTQTVGISNTFFPPLMVGIQVDPQNPLKFDFFMSKGQEKLEENIKKQEYLKILRYFLASMTIPEDHLWVNLSPTEKDRIIADDFSRTQMGMDLLAQDYFLKQLTSSLMNPDDESGKKFWKKIKKEAKKRYGITEIQTSVLNRVWVLPEKAIVYEQEKSAWVIYCRLKVMLEEDFLSSPDPQFPGSAAKDLTGAPGHGGTGELEKQVMREVIIPELEREVNEGKNFAVLRQIVNAMVMAEWYKRSLKESILGKAYVNQSKVSGIDTEDFKRKQQIYDAYLKSFQQGVYDFIYEDIDEETGAISPQHYFSGGYQPDLKKAVSVVDDPGEIPLQYRVPSEQYIKKVTQSGIDRVTGGAQLVSSPEQQSTPAKSPSGENLSTKGKDIPSDKEAAEKGSTGKQGGGLDHAMLADFKPSKDYSRLEFPELAEDFFQLMQKFVESLDEEEWGQAKQVYVDLKTMTGFLSGKAKAQSFEDFRKTTGAILDRTEIFLQLFGGRQVNTEQGSAVSVDMNVLQKEMVQIGQKKFSEQTRKLIDQIIEEVVSELFDDEAEKRKWREKLTRDIVMMNFENMIPEKVIGDIAAHKDYLISTVLEMTKGLGQAEGFFDPYASSRKVFLKDFDGNEALFRGVVEHELTHYGIFRIPEQWENISFAVSLLAAISFAEKQGQAIDVYFKEFSDPHVFTPALVKALFEKGRVMGQGGETGFIVSPGVSDRNAGYFSTEYLLSLTREVFEETGARTDLLHDDYQKQRAAGMMIAGMLLGMNDKDAAKKPLRLLKDFFDVLYERYGDPTEASPQTGSGVKKLIQDLEKYLSSSAGMIVKLKPVASGSWNFRTTGQFSAEVDFVISDLFPRFYDGKDKNDAEGQMEAARERAFGQAFLALSKTKNGMRHLMHGLDPSIQNEPASIHLWDTLLLSKSAKIGVDVNAQKLRTGSIEEQFTGSGRWIMRVFKDRFEIGNPMVEEALFLSQPRFLRYLDSLLYRRFYYDEKEKKIVDPRVKDPVLDDAVARTMGSATDASNFGWAKILLAPQDLTDDQIKDIFNRIWPVFQDLYARDLKTEVNWRAYQRKMREERQQARRQQFEQLSPEGLQDLEDYFNSLPEETREAIRQAAEKMLRGQMEQFGEQGQDRGQEQGMEGMEGMEGMPMPEMEGKTGRKQQPGKGGSRGSQQTLPSGARPGQEMSEGEGGGEISPEQMRGMIEDIGRQLKGLEQQIDDISNGLNAARSQTENLDRGAKDLDQSRELEQQREKSTDLHKKAKDLQDDVQGILNQGRRVEERSRHQEDMSRGMQNGLPSPEEGEGVAEDSRDLSGKAQELLDKLSGLQQKANQLERSTGNLEQKYGEHHPDDSQVASQLRDVERSIKEMKDQIDQGRGAERSMLRQLHELEQGIEKLERSLDAARQSAAAGKQPVSGQEDKGVKGAPKSLASQAPANSGTNQQSSSEPISASSSQPQSSGATALKDNDQSKEPQSSQSSGTLHKTPDTLDMPNAESLEEMLRESPAERADRPRPKRKVPDLKAARQYEEDLLQKKTGLNANQRAELETYYNKRVRYKGREMTVRQLVNDMTERLKILTLPVEDVGFQGNLEHGPVFDPVKAVIGHDAPYGQWRPKEPLSVKITFLLDNSVSMDLELEGGVKRIDVVRLTTFILLNALLNHNEERARLGYDPIEFEIALFEDSEAKPLVSHETVREKNFRKDRLLYETWNGLNAAGPATYYAQNLKKFTARLAGALDKGFEKSTRILVSVSDEDVDEAQKQDILETYAQAEAAGLHLFVAPVGNQKLLRDTMDLHRDHKERVIRPFPVPEFPANVMDALMETIPSFEAMAGRDGAMLTEEPKAIEGYKHFFTQKINGREYLVFHGEIPAVIGSVDMEGLDLCRTKEFPTSLRMKTRSSGF
ncbi:MAG: hypothetical protein AB1650_03925 [Candidatus Omnitrophota bacterium]